MQRDPPRPPARLFERLCMVVVLVVVGLWAIPGHRGSNVAVPRHEIARLVAELESPDLRIAVAAARELRRNPNWLALAVHERPELLDPARHQLRAMVGLVAQSTALTASERGIYARALGMFLDADVDQRRAVRELVRLGRHARSAADALRRIEESTDGELATYARLALVQCDERSHDPATRLLVFFRESHHWMMPRDEAFLSRIGWDPDQVAPRLLGHIRKTERDDWHLGALGSIGCLDRATLQSLMDDPPPVHYVRVTVGRAGRDCPELVLPFLRREIHSSVWHHAARAAQGLAFLGPDAGLAVPDLCALVAGVPGMKEVAARHVREDAARALGRIGVCDADVLEVLRGAVDDPDPSVRREAILALGRLGDEVERAVDLVIQRLGSADTHGTPFFGWDRVDAIEELEHLGAAPRAAVPALTDVVLGRSRGSQFSFPVTYEPRPGLREAALRALGRIGRDDPAVLELLEATLDDPYPHVRRAAAHALADLGAPGLEVVCRALGDEDPGNSLAAADALLTAGERALPFLERTLETGNPRAKHEARFLLDQLRQE